MRVPTALRRLARRVKERWTSPPAAGHCGRVRDALMIFIFAPDYVLKFSVRSR
jgi:hypothetical protein